MKSESSLIGQQIANDGPPKPSPQISEHPSSNLSKGENIRSLKGYLIYQDQKLGQGQFGTVCKARLRREVEEGVATPQVFACKVMEVGNIKPDDLASIEKEVRVHNMIKSEQCVRLHKSIKSASNLYMVMDYCNGKDLQFLLKVRRHLSQIEVAHILKQVVLGCTQLWALNIIHRDIKLANVLLHFPNNPELEHFDKFQLADFLMKFDFSTGKFKALISDFGLSTVVNPEDAGQLSICGTPLYSSPQILKRSGYTYKVDIWAVGVLTYELLMGRTPFHASKMKELVSKITKGDYSLYLREFITLECAFFLSQCL